MICRPPAGAAPSQAGVSRDIFRSHARDARCKNRFYGADVRITIYTREIAEHEMWLIYQTHAARGVLRAISSGTREGRGRAAGAWGVSLVRAAGKFGGGSIAVGP
jgi:hypothetical protein